MCGEKVKKVRGGSDLLIKEIQKNTREVIRINVQEFKGTNVVDVRVFFQINDDWVPTRKGISLTESVLDEVIEGLEEAQKELEG